MVPGVVGRYRQMFVERGLAAGGLADAAGADQVVYRGDARTNPALPEPARRKQALPLTAA